MVSIITPTYNCGRFIAETIESVLAQTYQDWEMLIVDDCSTDDTEAIVRAYINKDTRVKYHCLEHNSGAAVARNTALSMAKGQYIAFLDSDDLWLPTKLERQIAFMEANHYAFTYHEYEEIDEESQTLGIYVSGLTHVGPFAMKSCCWPGCLSVMYDQNIIGLVQIPNIKKNNDTAMWLQAIKKADCYLLKEDLARYRRRRGSITPTRSWKKTEWIYRLFREAESLNPISAAFWTAMNIVGSIVKKTFFVRKLTGRALIKN